MLILAIVAALGAIAFGVYLALLLRSIRKRAYGEGKLLDLPGLGATLRYPEWWTLEIDPLEGPRAATGEVLSLDGADFDESEKSGPLPALPTDLQDPLHPYPVRSHAHSPIDRDPTGGGEVARLRTGHHRGLLTISTIPWTHFSPVDAAQRGRDSGHTSAHTADGESGRGETPQSAPTEARQSAARVLEAVLRQILTERGITLDESDIRVATVGPERQPPEGMRAWVASGGRQSSSPEERSYFEFHLVQQHRADDRRPRPISILFVYTNSVLQGFLDAFYIEAMMKTLQFRTPPDP